MAMIPQAHQLAPQDKQFVERVTLAAQAVLAHEKHGADIVQMASNGPDGIAQATLAILALLSEGQQITQENAPVAAMAIMMVITDFLVKIGRYKADAQTMRATTAAVMDLVARQYGASDADIAELDKAFPGISQDIAARRGGQTQVM